VLRRELAEVTNQRDALADCLIHLREKDWFREGDAFTQDEAICGLDPKKVHAALATLEGRGE
jgi:hypothetical protein